MADGDPTVVEVHVRPAEAQQLALAETAGGDSPDNLVTACFECNAGKGARPLAR
jgi:hypothetical protein